MWKDAVLFLASFTGSAVVQQDIQNDKNMLYIRFFFMEYIYGFLYTGARFGYRKMFYSRTHKEGLSPVYLL